MNCNKYADDEAIKEKKVIIYEYILTFSITFFTMLIIYKFKHIAPFGGISLGGSDINYITMDQYKYWKDVLLGRNSFGYTLSLYLGGLTTNIISFAMLSPLIFIILLFPQNQFIVGFNIMVAVKISLITTVMFFYLRKRFSEKLSFPIVFVLSICYGFSQYIIQQVACVSWLEGAMILPLILLGLHYLIYDHKKNLFIISVAMSLILNWYTGAINCIFCVIWFFFEISLYFSDHSLDSHYLLKKIGTCIICGIVSILLACIVLIPSFFAINKGNRGQLDTRIITDTYSGNPVTVFTNYYLGSQSDESIVSLFCGSLPIIGCFAFFLEKNIDIKKKYITGLFLFLIIFIFYWQPFIMLFSMLKKVNSFFCRYSYIGSFSIIFISAFYFSYIDNKDKNRFRSLAAAFPIWGAFLLLSHITDTGKNLYLVSKTVVFGLFNCLLYGIYLIKEKRILYRIGCGFVFGAVIIIEMSYNASMIMDTYKYTDNGAYSDYVISENDQIALLKNYDNGQYRITQTITRNQSPEHGAITANYNEPMGFNYWGITGYTNNPDDRQRSFLARNGYRKNGSNMYVVNTSILGIDSLLGIKYLLSPFEIKGYQYLEELGEFNLKKIYLNPYALPMAFLCNYDDTYMNVPYTNPFLFQNSIYSSLTGHEADLYVPLRYVVEVGETNNRTYHIIVPEGNYALYGNLPWKSENKEEIIINGQREVLYARWLSPSVFYIPNESNNKNISLSVTSNNSVSITDEQFYALDLDLFQEITDNIKNNSDIQSHIENKQAEFTFTNNEDRTLLVSIGYDEGWEIMDNGKPINAETLDDCLILIPVSAGSHHIEMKYHIPGMKTGLLLSVFGIVLFAGLFLYGNRKNRHDPRSYEQIISYEEVSE